MNEGLRQRLESELEAPGLVEALSTLRGSDFHSLMLEVYRRRAEARKPSDLMEFYKNNRFVQPARVPLGVRLRLEQAALDALPGDFSVVELAPLAPLGNCTVLGQMSQDRIVSADRHLEVCADPTNFLALECAARRRADRTSVCRLAASTRVVRAQPLQRPEHTAHFRLWTMATAGRLSRSFQTDSVVAQLRYLDDLLHLLAQRGFAVGPPLVHLADWNGRLAEGIQDGLQGWRGELRPEPDRVRAKGYYRDLALRVDCPINDQLYEIADGGFTDWTAKLCADQREGLLIFGLGMELLALAWDEKIPTEL